MGIVYGFKLYRISALKAHVFQPWDERAAEQSEGFDGCEVCYSV